MIVIAKHILTTRLVLEIKQEVYLEVWDAPVGGRLLLDASGLRVDFDIRHIPEFSRATFTIYNLNEKTIRGLMSGDRYVTLKTQLHGGRVDLLANRFIINNAVDELTLPDRITKLFCFDQTRTTFLEKPIAVPVRGNPTLVNMMDRLLYTVGYGKTRREEFKSFPQGLLDIPSKKPTRHLNGNAQACLRKLEGEYNFTTYTVDGRFLFMYKPDIKDVRRTDLYTVKPIELRTVDMRSNPKIGIATCIINSNLNGSIKPTSIIDLSKLLVVAVDAEEQSLQLVDQYLVNLKENSRYQSFAITHTGSNYTAEWSTRITGLSPTRGKLMPTNNWASATYRRQ